VSRTRGRAAEGTVDFHKVPVQLLPFPVLLDLLLGFAPCRQTREGLGDRLSMSLIGQAEVGAMPRVSGAVAVASGVATAAPGGGDRTGRKSRS
jgi:hypothetical protein